MTIDFPAKDIYIMDLAILDGWAMIDLASGDHYCGSSATRANYEWCRDNWSSKADIKFVYGGNGSYGVAYRILTEDQEIHQAIHCMSEYACIQDTYLVEVEARWIGEAKDSWALFQFRCELEREHGEDIFDEVSDEIVLAIFDECYRLSDEQWVPEGTGMWMDVSRLVPYFEEAIASMPV
jgi:hypothetical protein